MKPSFLFLILCFISFCSYAQITAKVLNQTDQKPIPYVNIWVENEDIGVTADENGNFTIEAPKNSKLVFNALGYNNKIIETSKIDQVVYLTPKPLELKEVKVTKGNVSEKKVDPFSQDTIKARFGTSIKTPVIYARFFPFDTLYQNTPYLKSIKMNVFSSTKKTVFNLRLYNKNDDGTPGLELTNQNILIETGKGNISPEIDLIKYNILFPENGLFVGLEYLMIETNRYETNFLLNPPNLKPSEKRIEYSPKFGSVNLKDGLNTWYYNKGQWTIFGKNLPENHRSKNLKLAIELTLTN